MSKRITRLSESNLLHYKACYDAWVSEGTLERAKIKLAKDGVFNSYGHPYSVDGVRKSAVKHMVNYPEETMKMLAEKYKEQGYSVETENLERYMIKLIVSSSRSQETIKNWLKKAGLYGKHKKFMDSLIAISYDD